MTKVWNSIVNYFNTGRIMNIVWFFAILLIGIIVIRICLYLVRKILGRTKMEKIAQQFMVTIIKFVLWLLLILMLLSRIGIAIDGILTACSAVILAVGMALQSAIANVANGIIIISSHLFKKGDYISVNGIEGSIVDINFMFTTVNTLDNKRVTLPNSSILNNNVVNYGAYPKRRVDITFSVAYESDVELVKKVVTDVMKSDGRVYLDPEPFCRLKTLGASSIDFFANCWCDNSDYWDVYYYIMENVYNEFKRNNISIPFNQLEIRERKDEVVMPVIGQGLPERVEKVRPKKEETVMQQLEHKFMKSAKKSDKPKEKTKKQPKEKSKKEPKPKANKQPKEAKEEKEDK